jgi:hypothetical protein
MTHRNLLMAAALVALALLGPLLSGCGGGGEQLPDEATKTTQPVHCAAVPGACT